MFNLIVKASGWSERRDSFPAGRVLEYTSSNMIQRFKPSGELDLEQLTKLPTLFMEESWGDGEHIAHVGEIIRASESRDDIALEYFYDPDITPIPNADLEAIATELDMADFEFNRTHWAVKERDLFQVLLRHSQPRRLQPKVFSLNDPEKTEELLVSAMMPFASQFGDVHQALKQVVESAGLRLRRADDIWENPAIIQDVVSLIDKSKIVICDCTGRNPNVFYEAGIAHTLGREVILITQSESDIPFDLRHLRYVKYLNNNEGREDLKAKLEQRISSIIGS